MACVMWTELPFFLVVISKAHFPKIDDRILLKVGAQLGKRKVIVNSLSENIDVTYDLMPKREALCFSSVWLIMSFRSLKL